MSLSSVVRIAACAALLVSLCSCASSKRMMRLSPFDEGRGGVSFDKKQVNLWPFFYTDGKFSSIIWPMVDIDDKGFAVRPMLNKDESEYSILFPLCAWNPAKGDGWVLNTYWDKEKFGSVPLFFFGQHMSHVLNVWWSDKDSFGFFPVVRFSENLNHVTLAWWHKKDDSFGFFPVAMYSPDKINYFALGWYDRMNKDYGFFPIFRQKGTEKGYFFPLYVYGERYFYSLLGGAKWNKKSGDVETISVLGPLYIQDNDSRGAYTSILWPFVEWESHVQGGKEYRFDWRAWPLASYNKSLLTPDLLNINEKGFSLVGGVIFKHESEREIKTSLPSKRSHPLDSSAKVPWSSLTSSSYSCLLFFGYENTARREWKGDCPQKEKLSEFGADYLSNIMCISEQKKYSPETLKLFSELSIPAPKEVSRKEFDRVCSEIGGKYCEEKLGADIYFWPLFDHETYGDDYKWHVLYLLANGDKICSEEDFRVLGCFYRSQRSGGEAKRTVFPFLSWQSAPGKSRFSFLWRVFDREEVDGKVSGHVMFIPY